MDKTKELFIVGIDLSKDYTQVSFVNDKSEVESMSTISDEQKYTIPTVMLKYSEKTMWCIGDEALVRSQEGQGTIINNIVQLVESKGNIVIEGREYMAGDLLEIYMLELIKIIQVNISGVSPTHVVVSIEHLVPVLMDSIIHIFYKYGIPRGNIKIIGNSESYIYYVLNQKRDIWVNSVVLFDFKRYGFRYKRFYISSGRRPVIVTVEEKDFSDTISTSMIVSNDGKEQTDQIFKDIIIKEFRNNVVSAVFLTGEGFKTTWAKESLKVLCDKRRVFAGDNLIAKGAGYCGKEYFYSSNLGNYILNCEGRTKVDIGIMVNHGGREMEKKLSLAGENYYEAGAKLECILDDVDSLRFAVKSPLTGQSKVLLMDLGTLPKRPNKTTRLSIDMHYNSETEFEVVVRDKGFGEFFPSSGKTFSQTVRIDNFADGRKEV